MKGELFNEPFLSQFKQGLFEPEDLSNSAPLSLYLLCTKFIINNIHVINIRGKVPSEVSENLFEAFRLLGTRSMVSRFLTQLSGSTTRITEANLQGLEIKNNEMQEFIGSHARTLKSININGCNRLVKNVFQTLIDELIKVRNPQYLQREVTCYEVDECDRDSEPAFLRQIGRQFLWRKTYGNLLLKCEYQNCDVAKLDAGEGLTTFFPSSTSLSPTSISSLSNPSSAFSQSSSSLSSSLSSSSSSSPSPSPPSPFCILLDDDMNEISPRSSIEITEDRFNKPLTTDYELHRAMGLFRNPDFIYHYTTTHPFPHRTCRRRGQQWVCNGTSQFEFSDVFRKYFDLPLSFNDNGFNSNIIGKSPSFSPNNNVDDGLLDEDDDLDELDSASLRSISSPMECRSKCPSGQKQGQNMKRFFFLPYRRRLNRSSSSASGHCGRYRYNNSSSGNSSVNNSSSSCSANSTRVNRNWPVFPSDVNMEDAAAQIVGNATENIFLPPNGSPTKKLKAPYFVSRENNSSCEGEGSGEEELMMITCNKQSSPGSSSLSSSSSSSTSSSSSSYPSLASSLSPYHRVLISQKFESVCPIEDYYLRYFIPKHYLTNRSTNLHLEMQNQQQNIHQMQQHSHNVASSLWGTVKNFNNTSDSGNWKSPELLPSTSGSPPQVTINVPLPLAGFEMATSAAFHPECHPLTWNNFNTPSGFEYDFEPYTVVRIRSLNHPKKFHILEIRTWQDSPLESLSLGKSACPESENDLQSFKLSELVFHPQLKNLKRLTLNYWTWNIMSLIPKCIDDNIAQRLHYLDLSHCLDIGNGYQLRKLTNLKSLILFNCQKISKALDNICEIKTLKVLDISLSNDLIQNQYQEADNQLKKIVESLPNLVSLDISGTNLAGFRSDEILGLESRRGKPLEFLGIFNTSIEASHRQNIPAKRIAGDAFEKYILTSCEAYIDRVDMLRKCLNELFQLFRYESRQHNIERSLKILVCALGRHPHDKLVQVAASATLFYIVKSEEAKPYLGRRIKELIVTRLLDAMQTFRFDQTMLRNGCLNLIHFRIPSDVISEYTRLADILLYIVTNDEDDFVQRLGIYLLNSLACQVDGEQKTIVGNLGAIEKMLQLIQNRYSRSVCDEVMETAWSTMWNVTDETPINCERFLNNRGMDLFKNCMQKFSECPELLRNMMGLLGNVSECAHLRCRLMKDDYITRFIALLKSDSDGIEVSYNSAGILAHIASDGPELWDRYIHFPHEEMLTQMKAAISRWEINSKRNINYRSFEPILRILRVYSISWQAQYWAVWALANLTRVHSSKYCALLEKDGGVEVLHSFIIAPRPENFTLPVSVKCLAVVTLLQYYLYRKYGHIHRLEESNLIHCFELVPESDVQDFLRHYDFQHLFPELRNNELFGKTLSLPWISVNSNDKNNQDDLENNSFF